MKPSNEQILDNLLTGGFNDDGLPDPIEPVVVTISDAVTTEDEAERWVTSYLRHGASLLGDAITIAKETRSPRAIEVAHRLLTDMVNTSLKIKQVRKDDAKSSGKDSESGDTIKMSPNELLRLLQAGGSNGGTSS